MRKCRRERSNVPSHKIELLSILHQLKLNIYQIKHHTLRLWDLVSKIIIQKKKRKREDDGIHNFIILLFLLHTYASYFSSSSRTITFLIMKYCLCTSKKKYSTFTKNSNGFFNSSPDYACDWICEFFIKAFNRKIYTSFFPFRIWHCQLSTIKYFLEESDTSIQPRV